MLAAALRVAFAVVFMVAISRLVDVLRQLDIDGSASVFSPEQLHTQALLAIDGLSYAVDTFGTVLSPGHWTDTATPSPSSVTSCWHSGS